MTTLPVRRGEFTLLRKIGEGGMAEVFLAEREGAENFKTLVALKRLHAGFALDQYFIRQLVQEARLLGQLQHNHIVRVHDLRRLDDEYFIVMEYIDGIDLAQAIQVHRDQDLRFPLPVFFHLALCLCEALDFAHSAVDLDGRAIRLIHRDIKPSNVLISTRGIVKLTDFGIARVGDTANTGSVVKGTANYMSPEQAAGEQALTPASDIFSLGTVFWEMLTLEKLVEGSNYLNVINAIKELNVGLKDITKKGIEPALRMILLRMLARKRELRYQNMGLVLKDLRFVAEQMKIDLSPSHLRDYMGRIIAMAREAAMRAHAGQFLGPAPVAEPEVAPVARAAPPSRAPARAAPAVVPGPSAAPPAAPPPAAPIASAEPAPAEDPAFADSVAALRALVMGRSSGSHAAIAPPVPAPPPAVLSPGPRPAPAAPPPQAAAVPAPPPVPSPAPPSAPRSAPQAVPAAGTVPIPRAPAPAVRAAPGPLPPSAPEPAVPPRPVPAPAGPGSGGPPPHAPAPISGGPPVVTRQTDPSAPPSSPALRPIAEAARVGSEPAPAPPAAPAAVPGLPPRPLVRRNVGTAEGIPSVNRQAPPAAAVPPAVPAPVGSPAAAPSPPPRTSPEPPLPPPASPPPQSGPRIPEPAPPPSDARPAPPQPGPSLAQRPLPLPPRPPPVIVPPQEPAFEDETDEDDDEDEGSAANRIVVIGGAFVGLALVAAILWYLRPPAGSPPPEEPSQEVADLGQPTPSDLPPTGTPPTSEPESPPLAETPPPPKPLPGGSETPPPPPRPDGARRESVLSVERASVPPVYTPPRESATERPTIRYGTPTASATPEPTPSRRPEASPTPEVGAPMDTALLTEKARRGELSPDEQQRLRTVAVGARDWKESRALLLAHYEAAGNARSHCEIAADSLRAGEASTDPQFNLEMGKCHLREGRYQEALNTARVAELHAQDIPTRIRTDRQLKIWEVQAKAYKGLYQSSENTDYLDDSIAVWKRYKNLAVNTYRQREADRADTEVRALQELAAGAL